MDNVIFWIRLIAVTLLALFLTAHVVQGLRSGEARLYSLATARKTERPLAYWLYLAIAAALAILCWSAALFTLSTMHERTGT